MNVDWFSVFQNFAPVLTGAMDRCPRNTPCPIHGGKDGFRLFRDARETGGGVCNTCGIFKDGYSLLSWITGIDARQIYRQVHEGNTPKYAPVIVHQKKRSNAVFLKNLINTTWVDSIALDDPLAFLGRDYLYNRGIDPGLAGSDIRVSPSLKYFRDDGTVRYYPAILGAIRNPQGELVTLQRIYLNLQGGKAPEVDPKRMMPIPDDMRVTGGAVRTSAPSDTIGIAEGIETALAVSGRTGVPCWSAVNSTLLSRFVPPEGVKNVLIFGDCDRKFGGQRAARALFLALRKRNLKGRVYIPKGDYEGKSLDWLNIHNRNDDFPTINI